MKKVTIGLQPFTDFWVNCMVNGQFSILCSIEPSFKYAAYLNDYHYQVSSTTMGQDLPVPYLESWQLGDVNARYIDRLFSYDPFSIRNESDLLEIIKDLLSQKKIVSIGVNLFEWIPHSLCWQKHHWSHFTLIDGCDDDLEVFYVLDDDFRGYGYHAIPAKRFYNAVKAARTDPEGLIVTVPQRLDPFEITLDEVLFFSRRLRTELESLTRESSWQISDNCVKNWVVFDLFLMYIFQIANRQKANILLFQALLEKKLLQDPDLIAELIQRAAALKNGWKILGKNMLHSYHLRQKQINPARLYESYQHLIREEIEMWDRLLTAK
ncbi:MAG: hypothetical protein K6U80_02555 [Firmicutes bacterium]|nr:hypothetical protein [Bacillota bacterium]